MLCHLTIITLFELHAPLKLPVTICECCDVKRLGSNTAVVDQKTYRQIILPPDH